MGAVRVALYSRRASSQPRACGLYGGTSYLWQVRLDPLSAETYADMGTAYLARRELLASQREYELALQLQPANALAHANLVYLRTKLCEWTGRFPPSPSPWPHSTPLALPRPAFTPLPSP